MCIRDSPYYVQQITATALGEADFYIRAFIQMDALDKAHPPGFESENHRGRSRAFAEETDAFQERAFGHSGGGEDQLFAGGEIFRLVDFALVFDSHLLDTLFQFRLIDDQASLHVAVEAADCGGGNYSFGRAARSHHGLHSGSNHGRGNALSLIHI